MKSFRLDTESIIVAIERWPAFLSALVISMALVNLGWLDAAWRGTLIAFCAVYFGYTMRLTLSHGIRQKYPNASYIWLLSIGFTAAALGAITRMFLPPLQGGLTEYVWITVTLSSYSAFVWINRYELTC